jgi:putative membrane protein
LGRWGKGASPHGGQVSVSTSERRPAITHFLIRLVINIAAFFFVAYVYPADAHGVHVSDMTHAIIAAVILGLVNAILRPILIILTLPVEILTLGLFTLIINGICFWLVAHFNVGLSVDNFWPSAVLAALVLSVISFLLSHLVKAVEGESKAT